MESEYKYSDYNQREMIAEQEKNKEFFAILKEVKNLDYDAKVKYIKDKWGEIKDSKTIYYGSKCKIKVYVGSDKLYHLEFTFDNVSKDLFDEFEPGMIDEMINQTKSNLQEKYPELKDSDLSSVSDTQADYLRFYNNIKISKSDS